MARQRGGHPRRAGEVRARSAGRGRIAGALPTLTRTPPRRGHADTGSAGRGRGSSAADRAGTGAHAGATKGSSLPFLELDPAKSELQSLSAGAHGNASKARTVARASQPPTRRSSRAAGTPQVLISTTTGDTIARIKQWYRYHRAIGVDVRIPRAAQRCCVFTDARMH